MKSLKELKVIPRVAHLSETLAVCLGVEYSRQISDPEKACEEVLIRWIKGQGRPPTWK